MERPILKPLGTPTENLDTPALILDLDTLDNNLHIVHSSLNNKDVKLRPIVSIHGCPTLAHMQMRAGNTVGGIQVATLGQAEIFFKSGITDILITQPIVTPEKLNRLCMLAKTCNVTVTIDNSDSLKDLSLSASINKVNLGVLILIHTVMNAYGAQPGQVSAALAYEITKSDNLTFKGLIAPEDSSRYENTEDWQREVKNAVGSVLQTRNLIESKGIPIEVVNTGSTCSYKIVSELEGVTEIAAGTYCLMDARHSQFMLTETESNPLKPAVKILSTITSTPEERLVVFDAGAKAIGNDLDAPLVDGMPKVRIYSLSAEHGRLTWEEDFEPGFQQPDNLLLTPMDIEETVNVYDYFQAIRNGKLEAIFEVSARGKYK